MLEKAVAIIRELCDYLPGSHTWAPGNGDGWRCWNALSLESQTKVVLMRDRARMLLFAIEKSQQEGNEMTTEMQKLRQKVAGALARTQTAKPAMGCGLETRLMMQGVQAGSAAMLETVLDWIDEITEGKDEHRRDASGD